MPLWSWKFRRWSCMTINQSFWELVTPTINWSRFVLRGNPQLEYHTISDHDIYFFWEQATPTSLEINHCLKRSTMNWLATETRSAHFRSESKCDEFSLEDQPLFESKATAYAAWKLKKQYVSLSVSFTFINVGLRRVDWWWGRTAT